MSRTNKYIFSLICMLAFVSEAIWAQSVPERYSSLLQSQLQSYLSKYTEETVYVQTDKPFYTNGEDIWFTAFVTDASTLQPTEISNTVHVGLKDPKGNDLVVLKLAVIGGLARGDFRLPEQPGGIYTLTAYTQWMQNFGEDRFFQKALRVQKVITPNLLMKPDFEKKAYGPADEVIATLMVTDLENQPAAGAVISATVHLDGQLQQKVNATTGTDGKAQVVFRLPDNLSSPDGLLNMIVNYRGTEESVSRSIPIVLNRIQISFYPEGGDMVAGFASRIAFEALNEFGKGADVSGEITDNSDRVVASFTSFKFGMGAIHFTPQAGQQYKARITSPAGNNSLFPLPDIRPDAYGLSLLQQSAESLQWAVYAPDTGSAVLTVQVHGKLFLTRELSLQKGNNHILIPVTELPAGIAVVTLFDDQGTGQCERLVFVNRNKLLNISLKPDKAYYKPGEQVNVHIETSDDTDTPVSANLALSVVDDRLLAFADDKQDHILSYFLLSSELKGKLSEPAFYFDAQDPKSREATDYLLLTHGWRRFTWQEVQHPLRPITVMPEKDRIITGFVSNRRGKPKRTKIGLIESDGRKRMQTISTARNGQFAFSGIDPSSKIMLFTPYPNQVNVVKLPAVAIELPILSKDTIIDTDASLVSTPAQGDAPKRTASEEEVINHSPGASYSRYSDQGYYSGGGELSEMVVIGYGYSSWGDAIYYLPHNFELENMVSGRSLQLRSQLNASPGMSGISLYNAPALPGNEPLIVMDKIPLDTRINNNVTHTGPFQMNELRSINIMSPNEASFVYDMRADNGVLNLNPRSTSFVEESVYYRPKYRRPRYSGVSVYPPAGYYQGREYYSPPAGSDNARKDFRTTVYWSGAVITDAAGKAQISFRNNEATTAFRVTAEGLTPKGLIGRQDTVYFTTLPLSLDVRLPYYINFEDTLRIPVSVRNTSTGLQQASLSLKTDSMLKCVGQADMSLTIPAGQSHTSYFTVVSHHISGQSLISVELDGACTDKVERQLSVKTVNFPKSHSMSGKEKEQNSRFFIDFKDMEPGSLRAGLKLRTQLVADLFSGLEYIIRAPYGCFEQVSSSNYPNILAYRALKRNPESSEEVKVQLTGHIREGYKKLVSFEIEGGGFEWFGKPPAHTVLTAYGLMQFHETNALIPGIVSPQMMQRTQEFLLKQRNGDGTFKQSTGLYGFYAGLPAVNNAYICYALAETGTYDIEPEYEHALAEVLSSKDMYRMALLAHTAYLLKKTDDYQKLIGMFTPYAVSGNFNNIAVEGSIVRSSTARLEAVALWTTALLRDKKVSLNLIESCIRYIYKNQKRGGYGSTQATALCLKALLECTEYTDQKQSDGMCTFTLNGTDSCLYYQKGVDRHIDTEFFRQHIQSGNNTIGYRFEHDDSYPVSVDILWNGRTPDSHPTCPLLLKTSLQQSTLKVNETVRLSIDLSNKAATGQGMSMAVVGIPAGLSLQSWQLKELQEKEVFDFYEIIENELVLYYRELGPQERKAIRLDLKAEIPGSYTGAASSAYLYYAPDEKYWVQGMKLKIED